MNRRAFLMSSGAGMMIAGGPLAWAQASARPLPLIPMTDLTAGISERISLTLQSGAHDFGNGAKSATLGINQSYLGPVIKAKQGQVLPFDVTNATDETSTLHWHGLHIPGDVDGVQRCSGWHRPNDVSQCRQALLGQSAVRQVEVSEGAHLTAGYIAFRPGPSLGPMAGWDRHDRAFAQLRWDWTADL